MLFKKFTLDTQRTYWTLEQWATKISGLNQSHSIENIKCKKKIKNTKFILNFLCWRSCNYHNVYDICKQNC
jgi:hypothetical protein